MVGPEKQHWFIDSWDASAGRAFCSYRMAESHSGSIEIPGCFISPPFFEPQPVASRAIGLAAARGTFQLGFFIKEVEQAFGSIDELIVLIKRIYSSRGMWPGPGGTVPPTPSPPTPFDAGPSALPLPAPPPISSLTKQFADFASAFDGSAATGAALLSQEVRWSLRLKRNDEAAQRVLVAAGSALMDEMLRRLPLSTNDRVEPWRAAFGDLRSLCHRLHLLNEVDRRANTWDRISAQSGSVADWRYFRHGNGLSSPRLYDLLERLPLPGQLCPEYSLGRAHDPSLLTLLSAVLSYGTSGAHNRNLEIALLLFVAACVVTDRVDLTYRKPPGATLDDALAWLLTQLPGRKFVPSIEKIIRDAPSKWYRFENPPSGPSRSPGGSGPSPKPPSPKTPPKGGQPQRVHRTAESNIATWEFVRNVEQQDDQELEQQAFQSIR